MNPDTPISKAFRLNENHAKALKKLGLSTLQDLLYYFPARYGSVAVTRDIGSIMDGEHACIYGTIAKLKTKKSFRSNVPMAEAVLTDDTGSIKIVWFNQPYIAKMIPEDTLVKVQGVISVRNGKKSLANPEIEKVTTIPTIVGNSLFGENESGTAYPVYRETKGITSKWIFHAVQKVLASGMLSELADPIPSHILETYHLPSLHTALVWIHGPKKESDALAARKRFAFEEIFFIQLEKFQERKRHEENPSFHIEKKASDIQSFIERFPFRATEAQERAIEAILADFTKPYAMSRLLEGDVGSGKTAVAATTAFAAVTTHPKNQNFGNLQVAYMAPTEILAEQHFLSFIEYFSYLNINIGLITSSGCKKFPSKLNPKGATDISRAQLLKWVAGGEIPILIGTHSLIQKSVKFKNLAYVIIDEQHRFGTAQRLKLRNKDTILPHLLSMTATPIPRTLALTVYGDLDLTLLDEVPQGRKPIITKVVLPKDREHMYEEMKKEMNSGRQAYIICPRIDEPDPTKEMAVLAKSVKEEAKRLKTYVFKDKNIGVLHGKMTPTEKDSVMKDFKDGHIHILVATSVVEVGVNVPNATMIVIEGAERFGLAQLHQLRGRVMRSSYQPFCFVFTESSSQKTIERLNALVTAKNGFELAEFDLKQRGAGELYGRKQWGISDLAMEAIKNIKMVEAARTEAARVVEDDPQLSKDEHIHLRKRLEVKEKVHFE